MLSEREVKNRLDSALAILASEDKHLLGHPGFGEQAANVTLKKRVDWGEVKLFRTLASDPSAGLGKAVYE